MLNLIAPKPLRRLSRRPGMSSAMCWSARRRASASRAAWPCCGSTAPCSGCPPASALRPPTASSSRSAPWGLCACVCARCVWDSAMLHVCFTQPAPWHFSHLPAEAGVRESRPETDHRQTDGRPVWTWCLLVYIMRSNTCAEAGHPRQPQHPATRACPPVLAASAAQASPDA